MKTIVKSIAALMVIAAFVTACGPKTENSAETAAPETETAEPVVPADEVPADSLAVDSAAVNP